LWVQILVLYPRSAQRVPKFGAETLLPWSGKVKAATLSLHSAEGLGGKWVLLHKQVRVDFGGKQGKLEGLAGNVCPLPA